MRIDASPAELAGPQREDGQESELHTRGSENLHVRTPESTEREVVIPARREYLDESGEERIAAGDLLKGAEYEKGRFALFKPQELKRLNVPTSPEMEIVSFVKLSEIDPVYFNASYYVSPDRGGDKPYALLFEAMKKSAYAALATVAMNGRNQILTLRSGSRGILMHTLFFESEIHKDDEFRAQSDLVTAPEMKLAEMLVGQLAAKFDPSTFRDERLENMKAAIQEKAIGAGAAARETSHRPAAPVVDILEALRASLSRKPAGRAGAKPANRPRTRTGASKR